MTRATTTGVIKAVVAALATAGFALPASAACFYVYNAKNDLLYRSTTPPVDLSKPLAQGLRGKLAGGHLTMVPDESGCPDLESYGPSQDLLAAGRPGTSNSSPIEASPLFRNIESRSAFGNDAYVTKTPRDSASARPGR